MKLTALLFLSFSVTVFAEGLSQSVSFSGNNSSLIDVFAAIKLQTGYVVFYDSDVLSESKSVSLSVKDEPLFSFLSLVFKDQHLSFSIKKKTIVVKRPQGVTLSYKNTSLEDVLKDIQQQTSYKFLYTSQLLEGIPRVSIVVTNASVEEVLALCFKGQMLDYEVNEDMVVIRPKKDVTVVEKTQSDIKDPIEVRGVITDESGAPARGVNVMVKGTSKGTTTNLKGEFVLNGIDGNAILLVTSVGYDRQEILVKNKTFISSQLRVAVGKLDELQIIGYGTTTRRFSTGNVATVKAADIEKQPVQNPLLALQGRVPGIEITQLTGMSGGNVQVRIQGRNSIQSGLEPLYIIDGVPYPSTLANSFLESLVLGGSPLNYINPSDIESIDVLKDADATAIYGSRAANGAVLITTKKGKVGRTTFNLNLQQGWGKVTRRAEMMNTRQYLDMRYEAYNNDGISVTTLIPDASNYDITLWDTTRYTDWQKELIGGTASYTNINSGISGGTANIQYLLGASFKRQTTVFPGNFDDKVGGLHFNLNVASNNQKLRLQLTGSYSYDQNHLPGLDLTNFAINMEPNAPELYNPDGTLNWAPDPFGNSSWNNPLAYTISKEFRNVTKNLVTNLLLSYRILPGLEVRSSIGYTDIQTQLYLPTRLEVNRPEDRTTSERYAQYGNRSMGSWIIEPQLQYNQKIGKGKFDFLIGTSIQKNNAEGVSLIGRGYSSDLLMQTLKAAKSISVHYAALSDINRFNALFGRVNYIWDNKYLLNFTARRDGSNKFGDKNKFHNFWSTGLGWIFSEEVLMKQSLPFLSFGKFRASYGTTGNDQIPAFSYLNLYEINNPGILYQNSVGLNPIRLPNPYLQWEETHKFQTGIDLGFIRDRIIIGATYARNRSSNQLVSYPLPNLAGFGSISKNLPAKIQNISWEFMINAGIIKTKNFTWSTSINLTIPRNKVISFPGIELTSYASGFNNIIVGQPIGVKKVTSYFGVDPSNGQYLFLDNKGNTTMFPDAPEDKNILISDLTKWYGGLMNSITYKGFQLDVLFQAVRKLGPKDLYFDNGTTYPGWFSQAGNSNQPVNLQNRWHKGGDEDIALVLPRESYGTYYITNSDRYYSYDASFIRLKNISISWQLPDNWLKKVHLKNARLYINGQNVATITNYTGLDPESMSLSSLPPLQMWTLGTKIEL